MTKRKRDAVLAQQQANGELAKQRLHTLAHTQLPPIAQFKPTQSIAHNDQKLVALIARIEADGTLKVLASSAAADAINAVAANIKAKEFGFELKGAVMASDAFFPFPDCVEIAHEAGITAVVQPGGSIKDQDSIAFCDAHGMSMVMTGVRHFKH